jgi:hypothetical protein
MPGIVLAAAILVALVSAQPPRRLPGRNFPPEVVLDRFIDVAKVAPQYFTVEMENSEVRVLRAKLAGDAQIPLHDDRSGVIVALTDVDLRLTTPDKKFRDIHLRRGETHWIDGDAFSEQNLKSSPSEFLFIETVRPTGPIPYTPPA